VRKKERVGEMGNSAIPHTSHIKRAERGISPQCEGFSTSKKSLHNNIFRRETVASANAPDEFDKLGVTGSSPVPPIEKALHKGFFVAATGDVW
jgi:hypothetical protein